MNENAILNYPGSKKRLLDFILNNSKPYLSTDKYILDIFSGTGCVGQMYKKNGYKVYSNDVEVYSSNISNTLLKNKYDVDINSIEKKYFENKDALIKIFNNEIIEEELLLNSNSEEIVNFDSQLPKVWKENFHIKMDQHDIYSISDLNKNINSIPFCLFTLYYSGVYYGLKQSIDIDSIRFAIENSKEKDLLLTCLYYAMKESSFSKDGHMAQPLNHKKNLKKLFNVRKKNIFEIFKNKLMEFSKYNTDGYEGKAFNLPFDELINNDEIKNNVGFIYADPPYTDMQYSRYFHLLNTVSYYIYPNMTYKYGKLTTGLYADNRYQSLISSKSKALSELKKLINFSSANNITLCFSYAYPIDVENQATNRYTMNIDELIGAMKEKFKNVDIYKENYLHCNNRNSEQKKVFEYLIIGNNSSLSKIKDLKEKISSINATNKSPLYNNMLYWSQKPYNITDAILDSFSNTNDIVLDPFMGSGVTIIESLRKKYTLKSIGIDINDVPIFLCKNALNSLTEKNILDIKNIKNEIAKLYKYYYTKCPCCDNEKSIIKKIVYDIEPNLNIKDIIYTCNCSKKDLHKQATKEDINNFMNDREISNIKNIDLIENSRIAVKNGEKISDKFSKRSLFVLDNIKSFILKEENADIQNVLLYIYTSIIHKSKILDIKMSSQWPLWVPKNNCIERNVPYLFIDSIDNYLSSYDFIVSNYYTDSFVNSYDKLDNGKSLVIKKGTQHITKKEIPNECIDLIITDPPYLGQVPYSEYMQLYQAFLDNTINYESEIVITNAKGRKKDYDEYMSLMNDAFANISRMLKNNSYMFLYFHDSNLSVWNDLINIFNKNNLIFQTSIHIFKNQKTLKKILDPKKTMNGESLLIFKKEKYVICEKKEIDDLILNDIGKICVRLLDNKKFISTSELYDNGVLEYIIKNNLLESISKKFKDLTEIFPLYLNWDENQGMWTLKNE